MSKDKSSSEKKSLDMTLLNTVEKEFRRFLGCGWAVEYYREAKEYVLCGPAGVRNYSSLELEEKEELESFLDYQFSQEKDRAHRILQFILDNESLIHSDMNPYRKNITYRN